MKKTTIREFTKPYLDELLSFILPLDWKNARLYGDFLAQCHYHICHTTRLLAAAGAKFDLSQETFHLQCMKHAGEERSHEKLSVSDLAAMGLSLEDFSELPATKAMYRNAYYLVDRVGPITLFGYAYYLECVGAAGSKIEAEVTLAHGKRAVKHLSLHANEDPGHIKSYEESLDQFSAKDRALLEEAIQSTAYHYIRVYHEILARAGSVRNQKAA